MLCKFWSSASNAVLNTNSDQAFKKLNSDSLIGFLYRHIADRQQVYNFKYHEFGAAKTYYQSIVEQCLKIDVVLNKIYMYLIYFWVLLKIQVRIQ